MNQEKPVFWKQIVKYKMKRIQKRNMSSLGIVRNFVFKFPGEIRLFPLYNKQQKL